MNNSVSSSPKFTVSKETTVLVEPLRPDGCVDFLKAMNDRLSRGVTPENNAARDYFQAIGPGCLAETDREKMLNLLGLSGLPEKGNYLISLYDFREKYHPGKDLKGNHLTENCDEAFFAQEEFAETRPWSKQEYPVFAQWLKANERAYEFLMAGSHKDRFYVPLVDEKGNAFHRVALSAFLIESRDVLRLLRFRAMNELHSGHIENAWRDILAGYRWAWLRCHGPLAVDYMVSFGLQQIANFTLMNLISSRQLTSEQAARFLLDLEQLPSWPSPKEYLIYGERYYTLDFFQEMATHGCELPPDQITLPGGEQQPTPYLSHARAIKKLVEDPRLDWNEAFRYFNSRNDPFLEAWNCPDFLQRCQQMRWLEIEIPALQNNWESVRDDNYFAAATATTIARHLVETNHSYGNHLLMARMEGERIARFDLSRLALALARYRNDHQVYPSTLDLLCPRYIAAVPVDLFSSKWLIYEPEEDGYLLYSVGPNGIDDGGRNYMRDYRTPEEYARATEEEQAWDDIAIRMPLKN